MTGLNMVILSVLHSRPSWSILSWKTLCVFSLFLCIEEELYQHHDFGPRRCLTMLPVARSLLALASEHTLCCVFRMGKLHSCKSKRNQICSLNHICKKEIWISNTQSKVCTKDVKSQKFFAKSYLGTHLNKAQSVQIIHCTKRTNIDWKSNFQFLQGSRNNSRTHNLPCLNVCGTWTYTGDTYIYVCFMLPYICISIYASETELV